MFCLVGLQWSHLSDRVMYRFTFLSWRSRIHRHTKILCTPVYTETHTSCRPTYVGLRNKTFSCLSRSCLPINAKQKQRWNQLTETWRNKESIVCLYWSITLFLYLFLLLYWFHNSSFRICSPTLSTLSFSVIVSFIIFSVCVCVCVKDREISQTKRVGKRPLSL